MSFFRSFNQLAPNGTLAQARPDEVQLYTESLLALFEPVCDMSLATRASFLMMWAAFARAVPCSEGCDATVFLQTRNQPEPKEDTDAKSLGGWKRWRHSRRHNGPHYYACRCDVTSTNVEFDESTQGTLSSCETQKIFIFNIRSVLTSSQRGSDPLPECCSGKADLIFDLIIEDFTNTTAPSVPTPEFINPNGAIVEFDFLGSRVNTNDLLRFRYRRLQVPFEQSFGIWIVKFFYGPSLQGLDFFRASLTLRSGRWRRSRRHNGPHYYVPETSTSTTSTSTSTDACRCDVPSGFVDLRESTEGTLSSCETQKIFIFNISISSGNRPIPECCCGKANAVLRLEVQDFTNTTAPSVPTPEFISPNGAIGEFDLLGSDVINDRLTLRYLNFPVPFEQSFGIWIVKFSYVPSLQGLNFEATFQVNNFNTVTNAQLQTCE